MTSRTSVSNPFYVVSIIYGTSSLASRLTTVSLDYDFHILNYEIFIDDFEFEFLQSVYTVVDSFVDIGAGLVLSMWFVLAILSNGIMELITRDRIQPESTLSGGSAQSGPSTVNGSTEPHNDLIATISDSNQTTTTALALPMDQQPLVADHNQTS